MLGGTRSSQATRGFQLPVQSDMGSRVSRRVSCAHLQFGTARVCFGSHSAAGAAFTKTSVLAALVNFGGARGGRSEEASSISHRGSLVPQVSAVSEEAEALAAGAVGQSCIGVPEALAALTGRNAWSFISLHGGGPCPSDSVALSRGMRAAVSG